MQRNFALIALLLLGLTLPAAGAESPTAAQGKDALAAKVKPQTDAGAKDPADFPRSPGLVRTTYSQAAGKLRDEEIATYHSVAGMDEVAGTYLERLQTANWKKGADEVSGSDIHRVRIIAWTMPGKEAELRFYALKGSGSDLRVRIFTYKTVTKAGTADAPPATATPVQANASNAAAKSKATGAAPLGPPPTNLQAENLSSSDAADNRLSWEATNWTSFDAYRDSPGGWITLGTGLSDTHVDESALLVPNTNYRVVVHHTDGSEGSAVYVWPDPPLAGKVTNLQGISPAAGALHVSWQPAPHTGAYRVYVSGLAPEGFLVHGSAKDFTGVATGAQTVRVVALYGNDKLPAPDGVTITVTINSDNFRIVLLGMKCVHETFDDPLQLDGKGDEVFAGVFVTTVPRLPPPGGYADNRNPHQDKGGARGRHNATIQWMDPAPGTIFRTKVMGDTNGFPDRIRAGSASAAGGIQSGNFVPAASVRTPQPGVAANSDRFPLFLWEGPMTPESDTLVIAPALFEWDNADEAVWKSWSAWWATKTGNESLGQSVCNEGQGGGPLALLTERPMEQDDSGRSFPGSYSAPSFSSNGTRPIGLADPGASNLDLIPRGFVLTRSKLDDALGDKTAVVLQEDLADANTSSPGPTLEGHYILYLQIERVAATTAVRP